MNTDYELQYFTKKHKIFNYIKEQCKIKNKVFYLESYLLKNQRFFNNEQCKIVCKNEFDEASLKYLLSDFEFGLCLFKTQLKFIKGRNIKYYIIGGFLLCKKFLTINSAFVKYNIQFVCSNKKLERKLINAFEDYINIKDTIALITLFAIDNAHNFYLQLSYNVNNIIKTSNGKIISREMSKILHF